MQSFFWIVAQILIGMFLADKGHWSMSDQWIVQRSYQICTLLDEITMYVLSNYICIAKTARCMTLLTPATLWKKWKMNACVWKRYIFSLLVFRNGPKNVNLAFRATQATLTTLLVVLKVSKNHQTDKTWLNCSTSTSLLLCKIWYICLCTFYSTKTPKVSVTILMAFLCSEDFFPPSWTLDQ